MVLYNLEVSLMNKALRITFSIIGIVALLIVAYFLFHQLFVGFRLATTNFNAYDGLEYSEQVGSEHFTRFFNHPSVGRMFKNTIAISSIGILLGAVYVFLSTLATGAIRKAAPKTLVAVLFALPLAIPPLASFIAFSATEFAEDSPRLLIGLLSVLPLAALFSLGGLFVNHRPLKSAAKLTLAFVSVKLLTFFIENFDTVFLFSRDYTNLEYTETLTTYIYEAGLAGAQFSYGSTVSVVTFLFNLFFAAGGVVLLALFFRREEPLSQGEERFSFGTLASIATIIPVAITIFAILSLSGDTPLLDKTSFTAYENSITLAVSASLLAGILVFFMTQAVVKMRIAGIFFSCLLCIICTNNMVAQFIVAKLAGQVNTTWGVVLSCLRYLPILVLIFAIFLKFRDTLGGKLGTGLLSTGAGFVVAWGELYSPLVHLTNIGEGYKYPLSVYVRQVRLVHIADNVEGAARDVLRIADCIPFVIIPIIVLTLFIVAASILIHNLKKS